MNSQIILVYINLVHNKTKGIMYILKTTYYLNQES